MSTTTALVATSFAVPGTNSSGITPATTMETRRVWKAGPDLTATQVSGRRVGAAVSAAMETAAPDGRISICDHE